MSIERTYYCESPDCEVHTATATAPPYVPMGFIETRQTDSTGEEVHHFCSWDCCMKFAAAQPMPEVISFPEEGSDG